MLSPETVRIEISKVWELRRAENSRHLEALKELEKMARDIREQCPHLNTRNWFEYADHGKECTDCGKELYT